MIRLFLFHVLLICGCASAYCQFTTINDANFKNCLAALNPNFFNAQGQLIDAQAAAFTGSVDCSTKNITSVAGIEKFKKLSEFLCDHNQINNLDSIRNLSNLTHLNCSYNPLTKLPDLSNLSKLVNLAATNAQLTSFPDLSKNTALVELDCYGNQISALPGLSKLASLQFLNCYDNTITQLEDLSGLKSLTSLYCYNNKLSALPGIAALINLQNISAGTNVIAALPDLSQLTALKNLLLGGNKISSVPQFTNLVALQVLDLSNNQLSNVPDLSKNINLASLNLGSNSIDSLPDLSKLQALQLLNIGYNKIRNVANVELLQTTIITLYLNDNQLYDLPDLSKFTKLGIIYVQNNFLTFSDLEPVLLNKSISDFNYAPQGMVQLPSPQIAIAGTTFNFSTGLALKTGANGFSWYKNGAFLNKTSMDSLKFGQVSASDSGSYTCMVTDPKLQSLTLTTFPVKLEIHPCFDLSSVQWQLSSYECNQGAKLTIDLASVKGKKPPYILTLKSLFESKLQTNSTGVFLGVQDSNYQLIAMDGNDCSDSTKISLNNPKPQNCNSLVISADVEGGGVFIEEQGPAKIFDKNGKLYRTIQAPANWDGTGPGGEIIPGFYMVEINEKHYSVTVIR